MRISGFLHLQYISLAIISASCGNSRDMRMCQSFDQYKFVKDITIENISKDDIKYTDAGVTLTLKVTADIPCLRGGTIAVLTISTGIIGGNSPDKPYTLSLNPSGDAGTTEISGYVSLNIEYNRKCRVDATIGESSATLMIDPYRPPP